MIDWLAERYVVLWSKAVFFLENPTACQWIDFFQVAGFLMGTAWIVRIAYAAFTGHGVSYRAIPLEEHSRPGEVRKLDRAFSRAREQLRRERATDNGQWLDKSRLRIVSTGGVLLCNVGILSPKVLVSRELVRTLSVEELTAALAHELAHVYRKDNFKRVLMEAACLLAPLTLWMSDGIHLAVSSQAEFLVILGTGLLAGLALRTLVVPAVTYWQERRADEWAALATGDRLVVASALVATAASSRDDRRFLPFPATSFAFYNAPVSSRVRRLVESDDSAVLMRVDRMLRTLVRVGIPVAALLVGAGVHRAESQSFASVIQITSCSVSMHVERSASTEARFCRRLPAPADAH